MHGLSRSFIAGKAFCSSNSTYLEYIWIERNLQMKYRKLGKTGLMVSEVGFGGEWLERHEESEAVEVMRYAHEKGINIVDCWMPDPISRDIIGKAMEGCRSSWYVQGHLGSTYQNGQYVRSRDLKDVIPAFEDQL